MSAAPSPSVDSGLELLESVPGGAKAGMSVEESVEVRLVGFGDVIGSAEEGEAGSQGGPARTSGDVGLGRGLCLSADEGEALGEPVGSDRGAVLMFLSVGFRGPRLVMRTCGFHRIRLSAGRLVCLVGGSRGWGCVSLGIGIG